MRYNVLLLVQGVIAERCIPNLYSSSLNIKGICTSENFYNDSKSILGTTEFISNSEKNESELLKIIDAHDINLLISIQHPWILSEKVINAVQGFAFNLHNATIPDYKGHNTISHAILNGEKDYGTTIHWLIPEVDMGAIAFIRKTEILTNDTSYSLYHKMVDLSVENFKHFLNHLESGQEIPREEIRTQGKFYSKFGLNDLKLINDPLNQEEVDRKSRAFYFPPHEPAFIEINDEKYYISPKPY